MGTIAARDCLRVLQLTEQVAAAALLGVGQAIEIRNRHKQIEVAELSESHREFLGELYTDFQFVDRDRPLDKTLRQFVSKIQEEAWSLYS